MTLQRRLENNLYFTQREGICRRCFRLKRRPQLVGGNLNLGVLDSTLRATNNQDEIDRSLKDVATPVTVGSRLRTLRRVVYVPASPCEITIELSAELAMGLRTKAISDSFAERFCELSLDGLGPGVAPQRLNRGSSSTIIGQFVNALDAKHAMGATCSYLWARAWSNFATMALALTDELDSTWSSPPADMIHESRSGGVGAAVVNHAADLFTGRGFLVEMSSADLDQYGPALRCLMSTGPILASRLETTAIRDDGETFDPQHGRRCPELEGEPSVAQQVVGPVAGGEIHMLADAFMFTDPVTIWAVSTGPELRSPSPPGAPLGSVGDADLVNSGAPPGNPPGADFIPRVAQNNRLRISDLECAMRILLRAFPSPIGVENGWMISMNRMATPLWLGATDRDNVGVTASGQMGQMYIPHGGALVTSQPLSWSLIHQRLDIPRMTSCLHVGNKPATLFRWSDNVDFPRRLEAVNGREDGSVTYSSCPLTCSISATEAPSFSWHDTVDGFCMQWPPYNYIDYNPSWWQLYFSRDRDNSHAWRLCRSSGLNSKGENITDGQASIGYALAEVPGLHAIFLSQHARVKRWLCSIPNACRVMSAPVRLWACCKQRSSTASPQRGGSAIPCASSDVSSRRQAPGCTSSAKDFWSLTRPVKSKCLFLYKLPISMYIYIYLLQRHMQLL